MLIRNAQNYITYFFVAGSVVFLVSIGAPFCSARGITTCTEQVADTHADPSETRVKPAQLEDPVFRYAVSGGPRGSDKPIDKLRIYSNGNIVVTGDVGVADREAKLGPEDMNKFKDFILKKNDFFNLNSGDIEKRMNQNGATVIADGYSSIFSGNFDGKIHEVEIYSLWSATKSFPNFDEITKCESIEQRCKAIISQVNLGARGPEILQAVNLEIERLKLGIKPFKLSEMRLASQQAGGRFQASFGRVHPGNSEDPPQKMHAIYFVKDSNADPAISFYNLPKK
ncbi:MAG: hypothetical protein OSA89_04950 [Mariniblastus sp.]|nr:hypothetical protein [Mariniblastus sp.]